MQATLVGKLFPLTVRGRRALWLEAVIYYGSGSLLQRNGHSYLRDPRPDRMSDVLTGRRAVELPIARRIGVFGAILVAIIGIVLFVCADLASNRPLRLSAVLVVTLALLVGMVLTVRRNACVTTEPRKRS